MSACDTYEKWDLHRERRRPGDSPADVAQLIKMNHYLTLTAVEREARRAVYRLYAAGRLRLPDDV